MTRAHLRSYKAGMSFQNPIIAAGLTGLSQLYADRAVTPVEVLGVPVMITLWTVGPF